MARTFNYEDPNRMGLIKELKEVAKKENSGLWDSVAQALFKSRKNRSEVNIYKIDRYTSDGDIVIVPGKVLGSGSLGHKVEIAAVRFTEGAVKKIQESGSKILSLNELVKKNPKGSKIKLIG